MNTIEFLSELRNQNIQLSVNRGKLRLKAPPGALTPELKAQLATRKEEILALLADVNATNASPPIVPVSKSGVAPLSIGQFHLWSLAQLAPHSPAYTMYQGYRLHGRLNLPALEYSLNELVRRHEILRTVYQVSDEKPRQVIQSPELFLFTVPVTDITSLTATEQEKYINRYTAEEVRRPFDLIRGPLLRVKLLQLATDSHVFLLIMHHSISDGWSFQVFLDEFQTLYKAHCNGVKSPLPAVPIQYADFVGWQQQWIKSESYASQHRYWQQQLAQPVAAPELPLDHPRPSFQTSQGRHMSVDLSESLTSQIKAYSIQEQATLYTTLLTAFAIVLHLYSKQETFIICSPAACRNQPELQRVIGYFNNIVLMNVNLSQDPTIHSLTGRIKTVVQEAFENQEFPFQQMIELPGMARVPLSRAMFALQDTPEQWFKLPNLEVKPLDIQGDAVQYDIELTLAEEGGQIRGHIGYKTALFKEITIEAMFEQFRQLLEIMVVAPEQNLSSLSDSRILPSPPLIPQRPAYLAPRTQLERQLADIWKSILGQSPIGVRDNFFELGGHSLLALHLFTQIETELDQSLPLSSLIQSATIEHLAELIQGNSARGWSALVPIQPEGSKPPFFCIHGLTGDVLWFRELGQYLAPDQPLYGIQAIGLDGISEPFNQIEAMAAHYIEQMRTLQPQGPYYFGGASFGGTVALEMAQQILAQGEQVGLMVMFDHAPDPPPNLDAPLRPLVSTVSIGRRIAKNFPYWLHSFAQLGGGPMMARIRRKTRLALKQIGPKFGRSSSNGAEAEAADLLDYGAEMPDFRQKMIASHVQAVESYIPKPYPGRVTLFQARAQSLIKPIDPITGWKLQSVDALDFEIVDGSHEGMFKSPNVAGLARQLQKRLRLAGIEHEPPPDTA